ncbi:MAG: hypothetical protein V3U38_04185 [Gemmatimonadota bacterium]
MRWSTFQRYLLPGFVFQSVVIAGGYGTGRELVEFFLTNGPLRGLLGMLASTVVFSVVAAVSYELARRFRTYDYRSFFRRLLGPGWVLFEICYVLILFIVLAVIAAAAGSIVHETFGLPYAVGVIGIMSAVGILLFLGSGPIESALAGWSMVLYTVYTVFFVWSFMKFGDQITAAFARGGGGPGGPGGGWLIDGVRYAAYNVAAVPVVLFATRHIETRKEAIGAGLLTGVIGILPGLLFYIAMAGHYPEIVERAVPANYLLEQLGSRPFQLVFQIVLFGTLIETGTGMIHAVNERIARAFEERGSRLPRLARPATAIIFLTLATALSTVGLVDLIAKGYGTLTWFFLAIYVIPVLTLGVWILVIGSRYSVFGSR